MNKRVIKLIGRRKAGSYGRATNKCRSIANRASRTIVKRELRNSL